jgi:hypothetical protein
MKKELFIPYKEMIIRCIESCVLPDQLWVCHDMIQRFMEQFIFCIDASERYNASEELVNRWLQKQAEING